MARGLTLLFSGIFLVGLLASLNAAPPPSGKLGAFDDGPQVVRAYFDDPRMVADLAAWMEPWEVNYERGYAVVDVRGEEMTVLLEAGFRLEVDVQQTLALNRPRAMLPGQTAGIPGYPCYRTVEETFASAEQIVAEYPALASWMDIGDSWEKSTSGGERGYDLMVLRLTNQNNDVADKPKLFVLSAIHAREYTPAELNTRFAEYLVQNYGVDADVTWILDHHEVHLLLQGNPDGRKQAEQGLLWRKNTNENYCSATSPDRGADLNRNYTFQWGCCGGSSTNECSSVYRGVAPSSEPETQAVQDYVGDQFVDRRGEPLTATVPLTATGVFLDLHSYGRLVLWPWGFSHEPAPNAPQLQTLGRKLAYFNGYEAAQAIELYPTDGTTDSFAYGELGLAAYAIELGDSFFEACSAFEGTIWPQNLPVLLYAARVARAPYQAPAGPDVVDLAVNKPTLLAGDVLTITAVIDDTRFSHDNGAEAVQKLLGAQYYLDTPPWITETETITSSFRAADGAFDSPVEAVTGTLETAGLEAGRHILFARGQDAAGNRGPVSAVFFDVVRPDSWLYFPVAGR